MRAIAALLSNEAEHYRDAAVASQMRRSFVTAAGEIQVGDASFVQHAEGFHALGRQVDAKRSSCGGRNEEHGLRADEFRANSGVS